MKSKIIILTILLKKKFKQKFIFPNLFSTNYFFQKAVFSKKYLQFFLYAKYIFMGNFSSKIVFLKKFSAKINLHICTLQIVSNYIISKYFFKKNLTSFRNYFFKKIGKNFTAKIFPVKYESNNIRFCSNFFPKIFFFSN